MPFSQRHDLLIQDHINRVALVGERIREEAGEHVIERRAEAPDIADGLHILEVDELLAGHEQRGAGIGAGEAHAAESGLLEVLGHAEVGDAGVGTGQEDVLRFEVAMHEALLVGVGEPFERVQHDGLGDGEWELATLLVDEVPDAAAGAVFHDKIKDAALLPHVENADDVRMLELGGDFHLAEELCHRGLLHGDTGEHDLDGDLRAVLFPNCAEDGSVASATKLNFDAVSGDLELGLFVRDFGFDEIQELISDLVRGLLDHAGQGRRERWRRSFGYRQFDSNTQHGATHADGVAVLQVDFGIGALGPLLGCLACLPPTAAFVVHEGAVQAAEIPKGGLWRAGFEEEMMPRDKGVVLNAGVAVIHAPQQEGVVGEEGEGFALSGSFFDGEGDFGRHAVVEALTGC